MGIQKDVSNRCSGLIDNLGQAYGVSQAAGKPVVSAVPWGHAYALAERTDVTPLKIMAATPTLSTSLTDITAQAGAYAFPAAAAGMEVVSSDNTADKPSGAGALTVVIEYLDASYVEKTTSVTLNGTTAVPTTALDIFRINRFYVDTAGANGKPTGSILLRALAAGATYALIPAGFNMSMSSAYTVPAGKTLYVTKILVCHAHTTATTTHYGKIYAMATQVNGVKKAGIFYEYAEIALSNCCDEILFDVPMKIVEKVDTKMSAIASAAGIASVMIYGFLV